MTALYRVRSGAAASRVYKRAEGCHFTRSLNGSCETRGLQDMALYTLRLRAAGSRTDSDGVRHEFVLQSSIEVTLTP